MNKEDKEELLKEIDERLKQLRKEFIASLDDKKEFELTYPEEGEVVYCISNANTSIFDIWFSTTDDGDTKAFEHGLFFKTEEEAKQYQKERKLLFKLQQWAKIKNDGWEPDWSNGGEIKYYIFYSNSDMYLKISSAFSLERFNKLPYFKTREITQECIELFGDEIKEVLC